MHNAYSDFAEIYDSFMDNVPYDAWCEQTTAILRSYGILSGLVADLGCGTGAMTERLAMQGYDMIGIDCSGEMLTIAQDKKTESGHDILYLCQDMRSFELYGTVRAFVSRCDAINYLTDFDDLVRCFRLVNNYLDPGGIFVLDTKTEFLYKELLGDNTFARSNENGSYIWENAYFPRQRINEYQLTLYLREGDGRFRRETELHRQRAWSVEELQEAAGEAGLIWIGAWDADTDGEADVQTGRLLVVLREQGKSEDNGSGKC